jgi:hypothetical protein
VGLPNPELSLGGSAPQLSAVQFILSAELPIVGGLVLPADLTAVAPGTDTTPSRTMRPARRSPRRPPVLAAPHNIKQCAHCPTMVVLSPAKPTQSPTETHVAVTHNARDADG